MGGLRMSTPAEVAVRLEHRPDGASDERQRALHHRTSLEGGPTTEIVGRAWQELGRDLVVASSFQDCVLVDVVTRVAPEVEVVFLDTGYHFPETLEFVEEVRRRYGLTLHVLRAEVGPDERPCGSEGCCRVRKVEPLRRFLRGRHAWMSGVRRAETPARANAGVVEWDDRNGVVKINPLAAWSDDDVAEYEASRALPVHPLRHRGYASIGCAPTTRPVEPHEDARAGRWPGSARVECGLHS